MTSKQPKFDTEECMTCKHPKGRHDAGVCWSYGLVEPRCRSKCIEFKRNNLKWLEGEYKKYATSSKV